MNALLFSNVNFAFSSFSNIVHYYKNCFLFTCEWRSSRRSLRIESDSYSHRYSVFDDDSNRYLLKSLDSASTANRSRFVIDTTYRWTPRRPNHCLYVKFFRLFIKMNQFILCWKENRFMTSKLRRKNFV